MADDLSITIPLRTHQPRWALAHWPAGLGTPDVLWFYLAGLLLRGFALQES